MNKRERNKRVTQVLNSFYYNLAKVCDEAPPPRGRGQHADPIRDALLYLYGSMLHLYKRPKRLGGEPETPSWNKVYLELKDMFFGKRDDREAVVLLPIGDLGYLKVPIKQSDYDTIQGSKFAAIGTSGIRAAMARGKIIFDSVVETMRQSDLMTTYSLKRSKHRTAGKKTITFAFRTIERPDIFPTSHQQAARRT